jgi:hypothetical protein
MLHPGKRPRARSWLLEIAVGRQQPFARSLHVCPHGDCRNRVNPLPVTLFFRPDTSSAMITPQDGRALERCPHEVLMELQSNVFDVWVFRRTPSRSVEYLLLHTSQEKADRWFNGGRFWQVPSDMTEPSERIVPAIARRLREFGLEPNTVWAAEHLQRENACSPYTTLELHEPRYGAQPTSSRCLPRRCARRSNAAPSLLRRQAAPYAILVTTHSKK